MPTTCSQEPANK